MESKFQIGKSGITPSVINSLDLMLKNRKKIRISMLQSSGRNRENIDSLAEEICSKLKNKCSYKIIGFTIILRKHAV